MSLMAKMDSPRLKGKTKPKRHLKDSQYESPTKEPRGSFFCALKSEVKSGEGAGGEDNNSENNTCLPGPCYIFDAKTVSMGETCQQ